MSRSLIARILTGKMGQLSSMNGLKTVKIESQTEVAFSKAPRLRSICLTTGFAGLRKTSEWRAKDRGLLRDTRHLRRTHQIVVLRSTATESIFLIKWRLMRFFSSLSKSSPCEGTQFDGTAHRERIYITATELIDPWLFTKKQCGPTHESSATHIVDRN